MHFWLKFRKSCILTIISPLDLLVYDMKVLVFLIILVEFDDATPARISKVMYLGNSVKGLGRDRKSVV